MYRGSPSLPSRSDPSSVGPLILGPAMQHTAMQKSCFGCFNLRLLCLVLVRSPSAPVFSSCLRSMGGADWS